MAEDAATVQGGAIEVTDEDLAPANESTKDGDSKGSPKADEKGTKSQPSGAKEKGPGPWDAKLKELGLNDPKFDEFIRSEIQPYITQLEQGSAGGGDLSELFGEDPEAVEVAAGIFQQLMNDPQEFYRELGEFVAEQYGEDDPDLGEYEDGEYEEYEDGEYEEYEEYEDDPRLQFVEQEMQSRQEAEADKAYEAELAKIEETVGGLDRALFNNFVLAHDGDINAALQAYLPYHQPQAQGDDAPPVLEGGGTPPPEAPQYTSLDDALGDFMSELKARQG